MNTDSKDPDVETTRDLAELSPVERLRRNLVVVQQTGNLDSSPQKEIRLGKLFWGVMLLVLVGIGYLGYRYIEHRRTSELAKAIESQRILDMTSRHKAAGDWRVRLEEIDEPTLTDVREALIRTDGRPLLMSLYVRAITSTNKVHFAQFGSPDPEIDFVLQCTAEQVVKLKQQSSEDDGTEFAVIAEITSVEKPGESESESEDSPFLASGRCLDFLVVNY